MMRRSLDFPAALEDTLSLETREELCDDISDKITTIEHHEFWTNRLKALAHQLVREGSTAQAASTAEIIMANTLYGNAIPEMLGKGGVNEELGKKRQFIGIAADEPELAHAMVANSIGGFHGSNSSSLLGVLRHGLLSAQESRKQNIALGSGERTYTHPDAQPFISFADWRDPETLRCYSGKERVTSLAAYQKTFDELHDVRDSFLKKYGEDHVFTHNAHHQLEDTRRVINNLLQYPTSRESQLTIANFPVLYGLDISSYPEIYSNLCIDSSIDEPFLVKCLTRTSVASEFAIMNGAVSPEKIPVIAVPKHHIDTVRTLVHEAGHGIDVYPIDPLITTYLATPAPN